MILTINGQQAALKKGSSIEYVSENRIFTDADDYSMEIELPLADCPQNLDIFGMITRKDVDTGDIFFDAVPPLGYINWDTKKRVPASQIHGLRGLKNWKRDSAGIRTQGPQLRRLLLYPTELRNLPKVGLDRCGIKMDPKRDQKCKKNAERKGFEPLEVVSLNGFQDRRNRPLCHLSESKSYYRTCPFGVQKYCQISSYANFLLKFSISSPFGSPFGSPVADSLATLEGWEIGPRLGNRAPTGCFHRPPAARSHAWLRCQVSCQQTSR